MLNFSKKYSLLAGAVIVAGTTLLPNQAFAQTLTPVVDPIPTIPDSPRLSVIQGRVTKIQGNIVTVKTPDVPPYCPPGRFCPLIIVVGSTFNVNISRATFQSPSGTRQSPKPILKVGDSVVVAGRVDVTTAVQISPLPTPGLPPKPFTAQVVSKLVPPSSPSPIP